MLAPELPRLDEVAVDARILTYTATSAVVVAMLCGLFPAIRSTRNADSLASAGRTQVSARHSTQWGLVGVQVALSVTLLAGAGLLLRSFDELSRVDPGFEPSRVLAFRVSGSNFEYVNSDVPERINKTLDELRALPGVAEAATTSRLPGVVGQSPSEFDLVEAPAEGEAVRTAEFRVVAPTYFAAMQIPLLAGDLCRETEADSEEVMVNRSFAERFAQGRSIIGMHVTGNTPDRIVGIVGDAREIGTNREPVPTAYHCISAFSATPWFLIRASGDPLAMTGLVRELIREIEPQRSVYEMAPLEAQIGDAYAQDWLRTVLLTLFAATALALACLGIYGTLSYVVNLRRREVGLRVALGALSGDIVSQFLKKALRVVGVACAAGLVLSLMFTRALSGMLYGVSPSDPATLSAVVAIVVVVAAVAALLPAMRAARIDPMEALRED
jgi:putative ABC transport system permease protein